MKKMIRALIVEDSENDAILMLRELRQVYELEFERVTTAFQMNQALELYWDVIISDYALPAFDGMKALRVLQDRDLDIPFIIVSGAIGEEIAVAAMTAGANDYVMKGNLKRLVPAIERELREAESRRERRRGEAALAHLAAIVESSTDGILGMDMDGVVTSWNSGAEKMYGYSAREAIGQSISMLAPPISAGEIPRIFEEIKRGHRVDHYETVRVRKDGTPIDVALTVSPIRQTAGEVIGVSSIERDITARRTVEGERDHLIAELKNALINVKTLSGLLPICASCKRIRDDKGCWHQAETFIKARSNADFSHGMCPECMEQLYPGLIPAVKSS